ncbi:pyruvate kinase [Allomuricauda sp. SCSIO 65647]|uniref:pyruvate kinase n=1 Tax=Allomuricauda sp. SCSIO 65647 TaxID=2908843 RepID=UPI001F35AE3C|nr:pyruvate kinase [Muricauda sp. SCSIO 65647]UJH68481.1 pyruvate kinase [Muricauda sp. SCSIO 65647]
MGIRQLEEELTEILEELARVDPFADLISANVHKNYAPSAKNLYKYLVLRSHDLRRYHDKLSELGISSLRTVEGYVHANLISVIKNLRVLQGKAVNDIEKYTPLGYQQSKKLIKKHANELFGHGRKKHRAQIMVTLPSEAATDQKLLRAMVQKGMDIARINLSHGTIEEWTKMIQNLQQINKERRRKIKIYIDLSGPKIRVGRIFDLTKKSKPKSKAKIEKGQTLVLRKSNNLPFVDVQNGDNLVVEVLQPQIIDDVKLGDRIFFDDGVIKGHIISKTEDSAEVLLDECYKKKLGREKGINLPDTKLNLPALTDVDEKLLPFACANADIIGYSFVRSRNDVQYLYDRLDQIGAVDLGVVFKIENREAFENLPEILFQGMHRPRIGVMIARGDLAVELGFERISEVQDELLWLCEAAHVPVIWATQVLETLAKKGIPTRAEISDAARGARAECVMLNKGPYILDAIKMLKNILRKMNAHVSKKKASLRALNVAKNYTTYA